MVISGVKQVNQIDVGATIFDMIKQSTLFYLSDILTSGRSSSYFNPARYSELILIILPQEGPQETKNYADLFGMDSLLTSTFVHFFLSFDVTLHIFLASSHILAFFMQAPPFCREFPMVLRPSLNRLSLDFQSNTLTPTPQGTARDLIKHAWTFISSLWVRGLEPAPNVFV